MNLQKSDMKYVILLSMTLIASLAWFVLTPTPLDWTASFSKADKKPYGGAVLHAIHPLLFPGQPSEASMLPIYNTVGDSAVRATNYIIINSSFEPDEPDTDALFEFVAAGNTAFIAAHQFGAAFADSIKLGTGAEWLHNDSVSVNFTNPALRQNQDFWFQKGAAGFYFNQVDSSTAVALGENSRSHLNYVRLPFGQGAFFLSTLPLAFTNYNLLQQDTRDYACKALSYLPVQATIWDEYYKPGRRLVSTPLRFILSRTPLKWAWFVALGTLLLFVVFEGKRRQRIVPIVKPPANTTIDFVRTVGRLYYQNGDHKDLADKKVAYFLESVRSRFHVKTNEFSDVLYETLAEKSGMPQEQVKLLFTEIAYVGRRKELTRNELMHLHQSMEKFGAG